MVLIYQHAILLYNFSISQALFVACLVINIIFTKVFTDLLHAGEACLPETICQLDRSFLSISTSCFNMSCADHASNYHGIIRKNVVILWPPVTRGYLQDNISVGDLSLFALMNIQAQLHKLVCLWQCIHTLLSHHRFLYYCANYPS